MSKLTNKIRHRDIKGAVQAIHSGADVNKTNCGGDTSLHIAAEANTPETALELIAHGANPEAKNKQGKTPVQLRPDTETAGLLSRQFLEPLRARRDHHAP